MKERLKALHADSLYRNSFYLILNTATMAVFGFVFWLIVAHLYQPEQVGVASTLIVSMNFIAYLSLLGFDTTFIRFLPKSKSRNEQIDTGLVLVAMAAIILSGLFALLSPHFAPRLGLLHQNALFGLGYVLLCIGASVNLVTDSIFIAYRSARYNLFIDGFIGSSIQLLLPIVLISLGAYGIYAAQGSAAFMAMLLSIIFLIKKFSYRPSFKIDQLILRKLRRYSLGNYLGSILATLPSIVLPIIILNKLGAAPAAYYYLAFMMANVIFAITYAIAQSLLAEGSHNLGQLPSLIKRAGLFLAATMIPASLLMALVGPFVLSIFGEPYGEHSKQVVIILAAAAPFMAVCALGSVILRITKHIQAIILINLAYSLTVCGLALLWVHRGLAWVAGAWLAGQIITATIYFAVVGSGYWRSPANAHMPA